METIGERLKRAIGDRGYSVRSFAEVCNIPYPSLKAYASDKKKPGAEALLRLRAELGINIDWLLTGDGDEFIDPEKIAPHRATGADLIWVFKNISNVRDFADTLLSMSRPDPSSRVPQIIDAVERNAAQIRDLVRIPKPLDNFMRAAKEISAAAEHLDAVINAVDRGEKVAHPSKKGHFLTVAEVDEMDVAELARVELPAKRPAKPRS